MLQELVVMFLVYGSILFSALFPDYLPEEKLASFLRHSFITVSILAIIFNCVPPTF